MPVIGVFDSGIGGLSVANAVRKAFPFADVRFVSDKEHLPYGLKAKSELYELSLPILKKMETEGCEIIVVACNTITTNVIKELREVIRVPLVAIEPMIKPAAAMTKSNTIAVCATPATLKSARYKELIKHYAKGIKVIEPDCSSWVGLIENSSKDRDMISRTIKSALADGADVIVLGCTHYHWIEEDIRDIAAGRAVVIQPEQAIINRLKQVLAPLA